MNNEYKNRQETAFQLSQHIFQTGSLSVVPSITISVSTNYYFCLSYNVSKVYLSDRTLYYTGLLLRFCYQCLNSVGLDPHFKVLFCNYGI